MTDSTGGMPVGMPFVFYTGRSVGRDRMSDRPCR